MISLSKYRKISIIAVIVLAVTWLFALAACWNSLLTSEVKHEGWVFFFICLIFLTGLFLFYIAFKAADSFVIDKMKKEAYESGKNDLLIAIEKSKRAESEQKAESEDFSKTVDAILAGIHGVRSENSLCNKLLASLAQQMGFVQGIISVRNPKDAAYIPVGEYALTDRKPEPFKEGEGLQGQVAASRTMTVLYDIPENYFVVSSGLGSSQPGFLIIAPVNIENENIAVVELATFKKPDLRTQQIVEKVLSEVGPKLNKFISA